MKMITPAPAFEGAYQKQHDETKERLLSCAKTLLLERGFSRLTMGELAKASRLSRQRLYCYFHSLDDIAYVIQTEDMTRFMRFLKEDMAALTSKAPTEAISRLVHDVFAYGRSHAEDFLFTNDFDTHFRFQKGDPTLQKAYEASYQDEPFHATFIAILEAGKRLGEFRKDLDPPSSSFYWINAVQLMLERQAFFLKNGEGHSANEIALFESETLHSLLASLS